MSKKHKSFSKKDTRSWKDAPDVISPGEISKTAPVGYKPDTDEALRLPLSDADRRADYIASLKTLPPVALLCVHKSDPNNCLICGTKPFKTTPRPPAPQMSESVSVVVEEELISSEQLLRNVVQMFRTDSEQDQEKVGEPLRRFFQPLPVGRVTEWKISGMSAENIAMFLMLPEVLYYDYEKNKGNPPKTIFVTPEEAYDHPCWKGVGGSNATLSRSAEWCVPHIGVEIVVQASTKNIQTDSLPPKQRRGKLKTPLQLLDRLSAAKNELLRLKARNKKEAEGKDRKELQAALRAAYRLIEQLQEEVAGYEGRGTWGKIDVPGTGRKSFTVAITPCPEGCSEVFSMKHVESYIRMAFGTNLQSDSEWRDWVWTEFENKVIKRAMQMKIFRGWPDKLARAQWIMSEILPPGKDYGFTPNFNPDPDADPFDTSAKDAAAQNYARREDVSASDEPIKRNNSGSRNWNFGRGARPDEDERSDPE
jgi:hypothetical protein